MWSRLPYHSTMTHRPRGTKAIKGRASQYGIAHQASFKRSLPTQEGERVRVLGSGKNTYHVSMVRGQYTCSCPAFFFGNRRGGVYMAHGNTCKHIEALRSGVAVKSKFDEEDDERDQRPKSTPQPAALPRGTGKESLPGGFVTWDREGPLKGRLFDLSKGNHSNEEMVRLLEAGARVKTYDDSDFLCDGLSPAAMASMAPWQLRLAEARGGHRV